MKIDVPYAGAVAGATTLFGFNLVSALVRKGILSKEEAAALMVETANDVRTGSETGPYAPLGEFAAQLYESMAAATLGASPQWPPPETS